MKVVILTSSLQGTLAHHLPFILENKEVEVKMIIVSQNNFSKTKKSFQKKIRKALKIGILGALNGIRMRKWYGKYMEKFIKVNDIKKLCEDANICLKMTPSINCSQTEKLFLEAGADIGISLGNGYISKKIFTIPKYGMINIHHEILPQFQNAQSIIWQLYEGSSLTGFTIHKIDKQIDGGEILYKETINIEVRNSLSETVSYTLSKVYESSAMALVKVLKNFPEYYSKAQPQGKGKSYTTPSIWQFIKIYMKYKKVKLNNFKKSNL